MPEFNRFANIPRGKRPFDIDAEKSERSIDLGYEADIRTANRHRVIMENINDISSVVARDVEGVLGVGNMEAGVLKDRNPTERIDQKLLRERIRNQLYKQAEKELTNEYTESSLIYKAYLGGRNLVRAASTLVGGSNRIEARVSKKYGPNWSVSGAIVGLSAKETKEFVANRVLNELLLKLNTTQLNMACMHLGIVQGSHVNAIRNALLRADINQLEAIQNHSFTAPFVNQFTNNEAFNDFIFIAKTLADETRKVSSMIIYDETRTQKKFDEWFQMSLGTDEKAIADIVNEMLEPYSLQPIAKNSESKALLAELEGQVTENNSDEVLKMLRSIYENEVENVDRLNEKEIALKTSLERNFERIKEVHQALLRIYQELEKINNAIANGGLNPSTLSSMETKRNSMKLTINGLESEFIRSMKSFLGIINTIPAFSIPSGTPLDDWNNIKSNGNFTTSTDVELNNLQINSFLANVLRSSGGKYIELTNQLNNQVFPNIKSKQKISPFELLQKIKRREYCKDNNLDPSIHQEEAERFAAMNAQNLVEDVDENVNLFRYGNRSIAKIEAENLIFRTIQRMVGRKGSLAHLEASIGKAQRAIGLEPITINKMSARDLIDHIVNTDQKFKPFKGLNKFSNTAEIRKMILDSGENVSVNTLEEFIHILQEEIKSDRVAVYDWNIEDALIALRKLKNELWTREFIEKVKEEHGQMPAPKVFAKMLKEARQERKKIDQGIQKLAERPGASYKRFLSKTKLVEILTEKNYEIYKQNKKGKMSELKSRISALEKQSENFEDGSSEKATLNKQISELKSEVANLNQEFEQALSLKERVDALNDEVEKKKLGYFATKKLFKEHGLSLVHRKMAMNWRLNKAAKSFKSAGTGTYNWSRRKFLNLNTAKNLAGYGRVGTEIALRPAVWAWKAGTFPFKVVGNSAIRLGRFGVEGAVSFNKKTLRSYLRSRPKTLSAKLYNLERKKYDLRRKIGRAVFSWDKAKYRRRIDNIDAKKEKIFDEYINLESIAKHYGMNHHLSKLTVTDKRDESGPEIKLMDVGKDSNKQKAA
ncbi:hypothetical protein GF376_03860 [Candidatus Peregrinibacteria bacterium]|nr:hypothetical protein [Candidatus Peregrinibacteria bacterium]